MSHNAVGVPGHEPSSTATAAPPAGPTIPGYELLRELGHGRMGVVYEARQVLHDRVVALKVIEDEALGGSHNLSAFCGEARAAAHLRHTNIIHILEVGDAAGQPYLVTELVHGGSLEQQVLRAPLAPRAAAQLLDTLARAIHHAHGENVLHLDLDPGNVLFTPDGTPHLADFGLSYFRRGHHHGHAFPGNPSYAAPEQFDGPPSAVGPAADVYALGAILYECLTGRPPYAADTPEATLALARAGRPVPPHLLRPDVPRDLEYICLKCLHKQPGGRYPTALALAEDLRRFLDGRPVQSAAAAAAGRVAGWCRRNPVVVGLLVVLCVGFAVTAAVLKNRYKEATRRAAAAETDALAFKDHHRRVSLEAKEQGGRRRAAEQNVLKTDMDLKDLSAKHAETRKQLAAAEAARKTEQTERQREAVLRGTAEEKAQAAEAATKQATSSRQEAVRNLVRLYVVSGTRLLEGGDVSGSLPWFVEALRLARKEKMPEDAHRLRLAAVLGQCPRPVQVLMPEKVRHVALSPDGRRLALVDAEAVATLWDLGTGKRVGEEMVNGAGVTQAVFTPDGRRLLVATQGVPMMAPPTLRFWDVATGKLAFPAVAVPGNVLHVAFSPDGRRLLALNLKSPTEAEVRVFDAAKGDAIGSGVGSDVSNRPAAFSPDGLHVVTCCRDNAARVWDVKTGNQVGASLEHAGEVTHASFSPDGKHILTASADGSARLWHAATGKPFSRPLTHPAPVVTAAFSPDGRRFLTATEDGTVRLWDAAAGDPTGQPLPHRERLDQAAFSPDGRFVRTVTEPGTVRLWNPDNGELARPLLRHGAAVRYTAFSPEGAALLTFDGGLVRLWDLTPGVSLAPTPSPADKASTTAFSPDGRRVLRINGNKAQVYDTATNKPLGAALTQTDPITGASFSPDGQRLLTFGNHAKGTSLEGEVRVWEATSGKPVGDGLEHLRGVTQARFSPDGRRIATVSPDQKARVWDVAKGALVGKAMDFDTDLLAALFTPNGKYLLTVGADDYVRTWDIDKAQRVNGGVTTNNVRITHVGVSADSRRFLVGSIDGKVRICETATENEVTKPLTHAAAITGGTFSPDGGRVVTTSQDRTARVWDVATGKPATPPLPHSAPVRVAAFSDDGRWVVTATADRVRLWDAATGDPLSPPLPHGSKDTPIRAVSYGKDARLVSAVGLPGDPAGRWSRTLKPDTHPVDDLLLAAAVLTDQRMDEPGTVLRATDLKVFRDWQELRAKDAEDFSQAPARVEAWSRRGAEECERRQLWTGAVRHLDRLLATSKEPADLYARRARASAGLHRWDAALADYAKALKDKPKRADLWAGQGAAAAALGRWEQAVAAYSKAIDLSGEDADLRLNRANAEVERGKWDKAAADFARAIRLGRNDLSLWQQNALADLAAGDTAGYQTVCSRLARRFAGTDDEAAVRTVAWTCALADKALANPRTLVRRLERGAKGAKSADALWPLAALLYRTGQYDAALKRFQEAAALGGPDDPRALLFLAMTNQKLGKGEEAKTTLAKAIRLLDAAKPKEGNVGALPVWAKNLEHKLLRREAEAVVKGTKP